MQYKHSQSPHSLLDYLLQIMPDFGKNGPGVMIIDFRRKPTVNNRAATALFKVWKEKENKLGDYKFKRPETIAKDEIDLMEREGLIKSKKDTIEITPKGAEVIKTMILGDEKSAYEDNGTILGFHQAEINTKPRLRPSKKGSRYASEKQHGSNWWKRLKAR